MVGKRALGQSSGAKPGGGMGIGVGDVPFFGSKFRRQRYYDHEPDEETGLLSREHDGHGYGDATNGNADAYERRRSTKSKLKEAAHTAIEDARRQELKRALLQGVERDALEKYRKSDEDLKQLKNKKLRKFYEAQNGRLNDWLEVDGLVVALTEAVMSSFNPDPDGDGDIDREGGIQTAEGRIGDLLPEEEQEKRRRREKKAKWAINVNVIANVILLAGKCFAALSTGSLSLIASLVDSALDLTCTLIVFTTSKLVDWRLNALQKKFPVGRKRLEPLGILVFAVIMILSFFQILQESVQKLMPLEGEAESLPPTAIAALAATIGIKGVLWFACLPIKTSQVQALAQDCKTDVVFNSFSLLFPLVGWQLDVWWLDPLGAALLSIFIIIDWSKTSIEQIVRLSGEAASIDTQKKLLVLAWRFAPVVEGFKALRAYHAGDGVWVEFDVLMDEKDRLSKCHDVAETLQYCAESLPEVDRCFVSVDYSSRGPVGHAADAENI